MANALGRDIKNGEVVIIKKDHLRAEYAPMHRRRFRVEGGFGRLDATAGEKIFGTWLDDGEQSPESGYNISRSETETFQRDQAALAEVEAARMVPTE